MEGNNKNLSQDKTENGKTVEKIDETKSWFLDKYLAKTDKEGRLKITKIRKWEYYLPILWK